MLKITTSKEAEVFPMKDNKLILEFERCICFSQIYARPCLLVAGSGDRFTRF